METVSDGIRWAIASFARDMRHVTRDMLTHPLLATCYSRHVDASFTRHVDASFARDMRHVDASFTRHVTRDMLTTCFLAYPLKVYKVFNMNLGANLDAHSGSWNSTGRHIFSRTEVHPAQL